MLATILSKITGAALDSVLGQLVKAYEVRAKAETDQQKLEADLLIKQLEERKEILLSEQGKWYTAWIRPMIAFPVVVFVWKILLWDTVLGLGVTPYPGQMVEYLLYTVIGAYFLTRPFEKWLRK